MLEKECRIVGDGYDATLGACAPTIGDASWRAKIGINRYARSERQNRNGKADFETSHVDNFTLRRGFSQIQG